MLLDDKRFDSLKGRKKRELQKSIATIYQDFCLVENSTCLKNVLTAGLPDMGFFQGVFGLYGKTRKEEALKLLDRVGLLEKAEEPIKNLSGGQKQRVAIARALMRHPAILLADEPVASLDPVTGRQILELLKSIHETDGVTILMNSHNLEFSQEFSDRLIGLKDGKVVFDGKTADLTDSITTQIYNKNDTQIEKDVYKRQTYSLCHFQPFCQCRKRIPLSSGLRKPASSLSHMDCYRERCLCSRLNFA